MRYHLSFPNQSLHEINIRAELITQSTKKTTLKLASWRPGRYELAHFAVNIKYLKVYDANKKLVKCFKHTHSSWIIEHEPNAVLTIDYVYFANKLDAGNSVVNHEMFYINPINAFVFTDADRKHRQKVLIDTNNMPICGFWKETFTSFDELVDTPLIATNNCQSVRYDVAGTPINIHFIGNVGEVPEEEIINDFKNFSTVMATMMGGLPFDHYDFYVITPDYPFYHGVEHQYSNVVVLGPDVEVFTTKYENLIGVACHELFHAWNVCRLKPVELHQPDFSKEVFTRSGWVLEGLTTYYGEFLLARSGYFDESKLLEQVNRWLYLVSTLPGYHDYTMHEASVDLWMDGYRRPAPWKKPGIYIKGALIWMLIDWKMRLNGKKLDEWFRLFYSQNHVEGYTEEMIASSLQTFDPVTEKIISNYITSSSGNIINDLKETAKLFGLSITSSFSGQDVLHNAGVQIENEKVIFIHAKSPWAGKVAVGEEVYHERGVWYKKSGNVELLVPASSRFFPVYCVEPIVDCTPAEIDRKSMWIHS